MAKTTATVKPTFPVFVDVDQLIAAQQRNVDAFASAGQIVVDGAKAYALRQSEMLQAGVEEWLATSQQALAVKPGEFKPADQVAKTKQAYETALANAKELTEIAVKAQNEAFGVLSQAFMANLDDLKSLAKVA